MLNIRQAPRGARPARQGPESATSRSRSRKSRAHRSASSDRRSAWPASVSPMPANAAARSRHANNRSSSQRFARLESDRLDPAATTPAATKRSSLCGRSPISAASSLRLRPSKVIVNLVDVIFRFGLERGRVHECRSLLAKRRSAQHSQASVPKRSMVETQFPNFARKAPGSLIDLPGLIAPAQRLDPATPRPGSTLAGHPFSGQSFQNWGRPASNHVRARLPRRQWPLAEWVPPWVRGIHPPSGPREPTR